MGKELVTMTEQGKKRIWNEIDIPDFSGNKYRFGESAHC